MTATDELRRLLDERGVDWRAPTGTLLADEDTGMTYWGHAGKGRSFVAMEVGGGLRVDPLTPDQAVEATLVRGTCRMDTLADARFTEEGDDDGNYEYAALAECSRCGAIVLMPPACEHYSFEDDSLFAETNFCPSCGRMVIHG